MDNDFLQWEFVFFLLLGCSNKNIKTIVDLIQSENFEEDFAKTYKYIKSLNFRKIKKAVLANFKEQKDMLKRCNETWIENGMSFPTTFS